MSSAGTSHWKQAEQVCGAREQMLALRPLMPIAATTRSVTTTLRTLCVLILMSDQRMSGSMCSLVVSPVRGFVR
jgi:hypothetical protein